MRAAACAVEPPCGIPCWAFDCPVELNVGLYTSPAFDDCFSTPGGGRPLEYAAEPTLVVTVAFCAGFTGITGTRALPAAAAANLAPGDGNDLVGCGVFAAVLGRLKAC